MAFWLFTSLATFLNYLPPVNYIIIFIITIIKVVKETLVWAHMDYYIYIINQFYLNGLSRTRVSGKPNRSAI